eukprot:15357508-Ditylum_brightwellii.AAC.1
MSTMHFERPQVMPTLSKSNIDLPHLLCLGFAIFSRIARTKHTSRLRTYKKVDAAPKDDGLEEDDNVPKGSSFDDVQHSLRINPTFLDDKKKKNELGKKANSKDESDDNCTG